MKVAAVDLGTNSFLCLIADVKGHPPTATIERVFDVCRVVRLGEKVHQNRRFLPEALKRAAVCLDEFASVIKNHHVDKIIATATSAARDAENVEELMTLGRERGIPISIIGGDREAQLSFEGAISSLPLSDRQKILVVDVGGGSTEFIFKEPEKKLKGHSFDVGCVRLTEMFLKSDPIDWTEYKSLLDYAESVFSSYGSVDPDMVIAVAGTPTTLACVEQKIDFDEDQVEGFVLKRELISGLVQRLGAMPLEERKKVRGLEPLRADVIVAGGALLGCALNVANKNEMRVSTRGLRYGVAIHHHEFGGA